MEAKILTGSVMEAKILTGSVMEAKILTGSVMRGQNIAITKTAVMGGQRKLETAWKLRRHCFKQQ
jgi:hypothetical protein